MGLPIELPPLRARGNDIILLAKYFADAFARENKLGTVSISKEAKEKLLSYPFPGNVRELKAVIELSVVMCENNEIKLKISISLLPKTQKYCLAPIKHLDTHL